MQFHALASLARPFDGTAQQAIHRLNHHSIVSMDADECGRMRIALFLFAEDVAEATRKAHEVLAGFTIARMDVMPSWQFDQLQYGDATMSLELAASILDIDPIDLVDEMQRGIVPSIQHGARHLPLMAWVYWLEREFTFPTEEDWIADWRWRHQLEDTAEGGTAGTMSRTQRVA